MQITETSKALTKPRNLLNIFCRLVLGGIFVYASIDKIINPHAFADIMNNYGILPAQLVYPAALFLPWIEMVAGLMLIAGIWPRTCALILSVMLLIFIAALSYNALRGFDLNCGCFSTDAHASGTDPVSLIIRDVAILLPGLYLVLRPETKK